MEKVIFDTDIGDDIDDAVALKFVLAHDGKELDVLGVTTAYKDAFHRAKAAAAIVRECGKTTPVFVGEDGVEKEKDFRVIQYFSSMKDERVETKSAVDFILESARKYPHEITLLSLAPLCNLAAAYRKDPEGFALLKRIVMMGGCFSYPYAEWNIRCDLRSAKTVISCPVELWAVGYDITKDTCLEEGEIEKIANLKGGEILAKMQEAYITQTGRVPTMHDPLTASALVSDFLRFEKKKFVLCTEGENQAKFCESPNGKEITVATKADVLGFKQYLIKILEG